MNPFAEVESWREGLVADLEGEILEIGFGTGENLEFYRRAAALYAIEPDAERASEARAAVAALKEERGGVLSFPVTIDVAPAEALPYADARFDHVVSSLVFCSVNEPRKALREIRRVLRPQGALHMIEHVRPENMLMAGVAGVITPLWKRMAWNCHIDRPTVQTLREEGWQVTVLKSRLVFRRILARP
ncbi:MAG: class I SAM-dependent methyltransferase [Caldilineaceae bacterium]